MRLQRDYNFPALYNTENGAAVEEEIDFSQGQVHFKDSQRVQFRHDHLAQAARAIQVGVSLRGYFACSLMDHFEWALGYTLRYGLFRVDYDTLTRTPQDSANWYRAFIAAQSAETQQKNRGQTR